MANVVNLLCLPFDFVCQNLVIVVNNGKQSKFTLFAIIYVDCQNVANKVKMANKVSSTYVLHTPVPCMVIVVNNGKQSNFTLFAMIYDDYQILPIDVNNGKQSKVTLFAILTLFAKIWQSS